ncbi:hypothetical protein CQW23_06742 [Capsicum baccatum]|uniref:Disease resistance protein winged helix domain-containing protein n=1 Tax=Capsicum baccatum TaxID=33114 RepID=A0A2G2X496_CAPBA|nr:hypothetical protein CQW23_06742 [Capsicum baccatum]
MPRVQLTIVVVAGLLKSKREIDDWESVAKDVKSFVTNDPDKQCSRVLGLSYNHLTSDLKTCLLHFGIFPEDSAIPVKRLVRSWMAEGFLKLENDLEGEAEKCLQDLVDRCLVLVCKKSLDGTKIIPCKVHDLIYALCLREIQRENIFIMNDIVPLYADFPYPSRQKMQPFKRVTGDKINDYCRYSHYRALLTPVHRQLRDHDNNDLMKRTHSIFSFHISFSSPLLKSELIHFKSLKVLELRHEIYNFPLEILSLIWLKYLSLLCLENFRIPPEIYRLWNLQTFIVQGRGRSILISFPEEIWGLMQLRHLKLPQFYLPNPPRVSADKGSQMGFPTLLQEEGYETDLSIRDSGLLNNLVHLQQLETLGIKLCFNLLPASAKAFPATLKKLKLEATALSWSYLDIIAKLPNLEVLKLMRGACRGVEWHPNVRGFTRLKFLLIADDSLKYWKATDDNFAVHESLVLKECSYLKDIPTEFAEIHTLQLIELTMCLSELGNLLQEFNKNKKSSETTPWTFVSPVHEIPIEFADIYSLQLIKLMNCSAKLVPSAGRIQEEFSTKDRGVLGLHGSKCSSRPGLGSGHEKLGTKESFMVPGCLQNRVRNTVMPPRHIVDQNAQADEFCPTHEMWIRNRAHTPEFVSTAEVPPFSTSPPRAPRTSVNRPPTAQGDISNAGFRWSIHILT